jgi:hypothetical protein
MTYSLEPGTDVEVKSTFERGWARGFVIEGACDEGYHLRRRSDNAVLPATFPPDAVRPADHGPASSSS